jgi:hypothetical protein
MRRRAAVLALLLLGTGCARAAGPGEVVARPLERADGAAIGQRIGELEVVSAFQLASGDPRFGGLSGLLVEGPRLTAVSDRGSLWQATMRLDADGALVGLVGWSVTDVGSRGEADLEDLARRADAGLIAPLESPPRLVALDGGTVPEAGPFAAVFADLPLNEGVEALTTLPDGALLAIAEAASGRSGEHGAALVGPRGASRLRYRSPAGFQPTAADRLGDRLLVLERRFSVLGGLEARIAAIDLATVRLEPGAVLDGRELARLGVGSIAENFEGLAAADGPAGAIDLYLVSDDNFLPVQRTLLLQLRWRP